MPVDQNHHRLRTNLLKAGIVLEENADELARDLLKHMTDKARNNPNHPVWNISKTIESIGKPILGKRNKGQREVVRDAWGRDAVIEALKNDRFLLLGHHDVSTATHTPAFYKSKNLIVNQPVQTDTPVDEKTASDDKMSPTDVKARAIQDLVKLGIISVTNGGINQQDRSLALELIEKIGKKYQNVPDSSVWNLQGHFDGLLEKRLEQDPNFETAALIQEIRANTSLMVVIPTPNPKLETKRNWGAPDRGKTNADISSFRGSSSKPRAYVAPSAAGVSSSSGSRSSLKPRRMAPLPTRIQKELEAERSATLTEESLGQSTESTVPETTADQSDITNNEGGNTNTNTPPSTDLVNDNSKTPQQPNAEVGIPIDAFEATKELAIHIDTVFRPNNEGKNPTASSGFINPYNNMSWGGNIQKLRKLYAITTAQVMYIHGLAGNQNKLSQPKQEEADDLLRRVEEANNPGLNADPSSLDVDTDDAMGFSDPSVDYEETTDFSQTTPKVLDDPSMTALERDGYEEPLPDTPEAEGEDETAVEFSTAEVVQPAYENGKASAPQDNNINHYSFEAPVISSLKVDGIIDAGRLMRASFDKARQDLVPKYSDTPSNDIVGNLTIPEVEQGFENRQVSGLTNLFGEESAAKIKTYDDFLDAIGLINEGNSFEFAASSSTPDTDSVAARSSNGVGRHLSR